MTTYKVEVARDLNDLSQRATQIIASYIDLALDQRERAQIALSGGSTPGLTYSLLSKEHLPWDRVDVILGDERWVDENSDLSNAAMLRQTLLLSGPGSAARFYPVPTVELGSPQESANAFAEILGKVCKGDPPIFDLAVLGIGDDGHTASLFPGTDSLKVHDCWTAVSRGNDLDRITLTAPVLSSARKVVFLISGESKNEALKRLLDDSESIDRTPARLVQTSSEVHILADSAAADGL